MLTMDLKKADLNFAALLKKYAKGLISGQHPNSLKESLFKEIKNKRQTAGKDWLIKKIEDLR